MYLRELLNKLIEEKAPVLLNDGNKDWEAHALLSTLSEPMLKRSVYMQPGLYIAEINPAGYLGAVLFKCKSKAN